MVGVCAPGGPPDPQALALGLEAVRALGLEPRLAAGVKERHLFTAGTRQARLRDLLDLLEAREVAAIWCARGGAGTAQLMTELSADLVRKSRKPVIGYSDATLLHLLWEQAGVNSIHGPMVAIELSRGDAEPRSLRKALFAEGSAWSSKAQELRSFRPGRVEGRLTGGCLSLLAVAAGTPWRFRADPKGSVLLLEEVDERPYRLDRLLWQLRVSGALAGVRGIVFGALNGCEPPPGSGYSLDDVIDEALEGLEIPIAMDLSVGHLAEGVGHLSLPFGVRCRLECGPRGARLALLEHGLTWTEENGRL